MLIGLIINATLAATVLWLTNTGRSRMEKVQHKINELRSVMQYLKVKGKIFDEISGFLERTEATRQNQNMINAFLSGLSPSLRKEVMMDTFSHLLFHNETIAVSYERDDEFV